MADDGSVTAPGDGCAQARRCWRLILKALGDLDAGASNVVRTRMYVTDISRWDEFARAHHEVFANHHPATTMVEVSALIHPDMLIEIEADAVCGG